MATLMAMPYKYLLNGKLVKMYSTNFLAIHRSLREKRLASVIIGEALRRVRRKGWPTALYTTFHAMPLPFVTCNTMNRFLDPLKLREIGFANV